MTNRRRFLRTSGLALGASVWPGTPFRAAAGGDAKRLRERVEGPVLLPGDDLYDASRRVASHNPTTDKYPAVIVGPSSAAGVAYAIRFAREHDLDLAVQSGGHDVLGQSTVDGGVLIHLGLMTSVRQEGARVRVQPGVSAGQLNQELGQQGMALPLGCHPNVGVAGLTLGGGLGWLLGAMGVTCDQVSAFEIVLASGDTVIATNEHHVDLFWALKGGGGNFGVVTSIDYEARPLQRVARGFIVIAGEHLPSFMAAWDRFMASIPRELVVELVLTRDPAPLIQVTYCHASPESFDIGLLDPLLAAAPLATHHDVVPYPKLTDVPHALLRRFAPTANPRAAGGEAYNYWRGASCAGWSDTAIRALEVSFESSPPGATIGIGHYVHGAALDTEASSSALVRTPGTSSYFFNTNWGSNEPSERHTRWVRDAMRRQAAFAAPTYINYLSTNDAPAVALAYGSHYSRLSEIKSEYDPTNLFRGNRNILPVSRNREPQ